MSENGVFHEEPLEFYLKAGCGIYKTCAQVSSRATKRTLIPLFVQYFNKSI